MSDLRKQQFVFEFTVTKALRVLLLRILHQYRGGNIENPVDESSFFSPEVISKLNECGTEITPEKFAGELVTSARVYHHGLNSIAFHRSQNQLLSYLKARIPDTERLKLMQIITASQRYTLRHAENLCLDVYNIPLEILLVIFRDFMPETLRKFGAKEHLNFDVLEFIYDVTRIRREFLHQTYTDQEEILDMLKDIFEKCSKLRINYLKRILSTSYKPNARFWNTYMVSSLHFVCNLEETNIPITLKRKTSIVSAVSPDLPRMQRTHGFHCCRCECVKYERQRSLCICQRYQRRRKRHHSAESPYCRFINIDNVPSSSLQTPLLLENNFNYDLWEARVSDGLEYEEYGPENFTNVFVNEARNSIGQVYVETKLFGVEKGTAVCIGKTFILSAYHVFRYLLREGTEGNDVVFVKRAIILFEGNVLCLKGAEETERCYPYEVVFENEKEDWVILKITEPPPFRLKPFSLSYKEVQEEALEDRDHPEGWPLCMHAAGYSRGKLRINERMKILHLPEREAKLKEFCKIFSRDDIKNFNPIKKLQKRIYNRCARANIDEDKVKEEELRKFLFAKNTDVFFMAGLLHGASGSPCLVFNKLNHPVIHALLLGGCPRDVFNDPRSMHKFPSSYLFRRGVTAFTLYRTLQKLQPKLKHCSIAENTDTSTWMLKDDMS